MSKVDTYDTIVVTLYMLLQMSMVIRLGVLAMASISVVM